MPPLIEGVTYVHTIEFLEAVDNVMQYVLLVCDILLVTHVLCILSAASIIHRYISIYNDD